MSDSWRDCTLGDVVELKRGYDLPASDRRPGNVPIVSSSGPSGLHAEAKVRGPGVVTGRYGTLGQVFYVSADFWPLNTTLYVRDFKGHDPRFVSYFLRTIDFLAYSDKAAVPGLNRNHLHTARVRVPPLKDQRRISALLSSLDDKIELNRQMNETLEAMARALFKSWFVDFDPVRAKMAGRTPFGMDAATAALFTSSMEGDRPRGWRLAPYGQGLSITKGKSYKSDELRPSHTALVTLKSFLRGGGYRHDGLKAYVGAYKPEQVVKAGDLVIAFTDVTQAAEVIGKPALVQATRDFSTLVASLDVGVVRPTASELPTEYLYYTFLEPSFQDHAYAHANGSTVLHLAGDAVEKYLGLWPPTSVAMAFRDCVARWLRRQQMADEESATLAELRDLLLPKLLSGELRIRDAEKAVEAVV